MSVKEIPKYPYAFLRDILHVGGGGGGVSIIVMLLYVPHADYERGKCLISIWGAQKQSNAAERFVISQKMMS